jgi:hypothetical protein
MHFERDIYHNHKIDGNNMGSIHFERNVYWNKCPNVGDYDTLYGSTQMCACFDIDWASNMDDHKFVIGYIFLLGNGAIS